MTRKSITANVKGQVTIPAALRKRVGIVSGEPLTMYEDGGRIVIQPTLAFIRSLKGAIKDPEGRIMKDLLRSRRGDWR